MWLLHHHTFRLVYISHYSYVIISAMVYQITGVSIVYSTVCSGAEQGRHQSSTSLAFVRGIHRWPVNSPHKGPVTWKIFPFDDVIMLVKGSFGIQWYSISRTKLLTEFNSPWPSDAKWHKIDLDQHWFMHCFLGAPRHYLNQVDLLSKGSIVI